MYKPAWPLDTVMAHLKAGCGQHFDPVLVDCFCGHVKQALDIVRRFPDAIPTAGDTAGDTAAGGPVTGPWASC